MARPMPMSETIPSMRSVLLSLAAPGSLRIVGDAGVRGHPTWLGSV